MCKSVIETDKVCNKTKFLFCFLSDALFIAGIKTLLVGMVVIKIPNAKAEIRLLMFKLNKPIKADTSKTKPQKYGKVLRINALAMSTSKNLKDSVPNPTLKRSMPPNKNDAKRRAMSSMSKIGFYK